METAAKGLMKKPYSFAWIGCCVGVAVVQYLAVRLGLVMGIAHGNVSPVWPATGFAIAVLLTIRCKSLARRGRRLISWARTDGGGNLSGDG